MKIKKIELSKALETVMPGLSSSDTIEGATSFCFMNGNVVTYNDEISVSCPVPSLDITGAINASELYSFVNKVKTEEINLEITEKELVFKSGRSKAGLSLQADIQLPVEELGEVQKWKKIPTDFLKAISFAMASCSSDNTRPILKCVHVNKTVVEAADNFRLTVFNLSEKIALDEFLIPASSCRSVIKFNPVKVAETNGWIHFKNDEGAVLSCRLFEDKYVELAPHMKVKGNKITFPKSISEILERASIFSKRDRALDEMITVSLKGGKMEINSESSTGWFSEKVKSDYKGDDLTFKIAPYLLKDILKETDTATVSDSKIIFEGESWKYLSMLKV